MGRAIFHFILCMGAAHVAFGQMAPQYDSYVTMALDPGQSKAYVSAHLEGTTSPCSGPCMSTVHQGKVYNKFGTVGGWVVGPQISPSAYMNVTNTQGIPAAKGATVTGEIDTFVLCSVAGTLISVYWPVKFHWGYDYMWYNDPLPIGLTNKCSWAIADSVQCHSVCRAIIDPIQAPCGPAGGTFYNSTLDIVPWIELQIFSRIYGAGLNGSVFEVKQGSSGPAAACSSIPAHWGNW